MRHREGAGFSACSPGGARPLPHACHARILPPLRATRPHAGFIGISGLSAPLLSHRSSPRASFARACVSAMRPPIWRLSVQPAKESNVTSRTSARRRRARGASRPWTAQLLAGCSCGRAASGGMPAGSRKQRRPRSRTAGRRTRGRANPSERRSPGRISRPGIALCRVGRFYWNGELRRPAQGRDDTDGPSARRQDARITNIKNSIQDVCDDEHARCKQHHAAAARMRAQPTSRVRSVAVRRAQPRMRRCRSPGRERAERRDRRRNRCTAANQRKYANPDPIAPANRSARNVRSSIGQS